MSPKNARNSALETSPTHSAALSVQIAAGEGSPIDALGGAGVPAWLESGHRAKTLDSCGGPPVARLGSRRALSVVRMSVFLEWATNRHCQQGIPGLTIPRVSQ